MKSNDSPTLVESCPLEELNEYRRLPVYVQLSKRLTIAPSRSDANLAQPHTQLNIAAYGLKDAAFYIEPMPLSKPDLGQF